MCDLCRLVSDDIDGGVFITSQPPCPKGRELAMARGVAIPLLPLDLLEAKLQPAIDVLGSCAERGASLNPDPDKRHFFAGDQKACDDIAPMVIEAAFRGKPLPARRRPCNESPE